MKRRVEIRMSPTEMARLRRLALDRKRSRADTVRTILDEEYERLSQRGETAGNANETTREA